MATSGTLSPPLAQTPSVAPAPASTPKSPTQSATGANLNPRHTWAIQPIVLETVNKLGANDKDGFEPTIDIINHLVYMFKTFWNGKTLSPYSKELKAENEMLKSQSAYNNHEIAYATQTMKLVDDVVSGVNASLLLKRNMSGERSS